MVGILRGTLEDVLAMFRAALPQGVEFVAGPEAEPRHRYRLLLSKVNRRPVVFPMDRRIARRLLDHLGYGEAKQEAAEGGETRDFGLAPGPRARWPLLSRPAAETAVVWHMGVAKQLVFYLDMRTGRPLGVLKLARSRRVALGLVRELDILAGLHLRGLRVGPWPIAAAHPIEGGRGCRAALQGFVSGAPIEADAIAPVSRWLGRLRLPEVRMSLVQHADRLRERIANEGNPVLFPQRLQRLLDRVRDRRPVPAAVFHGDLGVANMLRAPDGRLKAIDWEMAEASGPPFLDLVSFALNPQYLDPAARSFERLFAPERVRLIEACLGDAFPEGAPALDELLALHFAQNYIDKATVFGIETGPRGGRLYKLLVSPWPFGGVVDD